MDEGGGRRQGILVQNPLLFDHIVQHIISFVDVGFLPSCRLVSRQWESFALPKLLQNVHKIPLAITGQGTTSENYSKMARYLRYKAENPRLILNNFTLKNMALFSGEPLVDKFISTCATEITNLRLDFNYYQSPKTLIKWMGTLVNLKTLTLDMYSRLDGPDLQLLPMTPHVSWKSNLKRLCINSNANDINGVNLNSMLNLLPVLRVCGSLEELSLEGRIHWFELEQFIDAVPLHFPNALVEISVELMHSGTLEYLLDQQQQNLKLKVLRCQRLEVWYGEIRRFSKVLEKYKNTLESVVVVEVKIESINLWDRAYKITFPDMMPKLKVFQMGLSAISSNDALRASRIEFSPVNFPVQLPSLEKLILYDGRTPNQRKDQGEWEYLRGFFEGSGPHAKLTTLCLPFVSSKLRKSVESVFPEIRSLKVEFLLDQDFQKIWEMWPQLRSLDLTLNGDRKKMSENRLYEFLLTFYNLVPGSSNDTDPDPGLISIANLKDLKQFKLRMIGDCKDSLVDFSITRAFRKSPCLEFLLFYQHDITKRGTRQFLKYHPLLKRVVCPVHPEVYKIQKEYLPNDFIPSEFSTGDAGCNCSFSN